MSENVEELVGDYMAIRAKREELERMDQELKETQDRLKEKLLVICNDAKADSIKTSAGTVIKQLKERYYTQDWEGFHKFILEHQIPELLEKRISQGAMKEFIASTMLDGLPPGVNIFREFEITVRKPTRAS
jgi:hypothetical protein